MKYCETIYQTKRWATRQIIVGNIGVGGNNPVRIQSMTTSDTRDAAATIEQIIMLVDVGCEIVRVTVQGMKEADACEAIKNGLIQKGYTIPIVADIHFYPPAAMRVVDFVDKVRINPGNFVDKRASFKVLEYDDNSYALELERIEEKFTPLIEKCKKLKRAMRIGTNHGSLSDRIMNRYGDTAQGMVESALEFTRVCRKNDYHDIIFSMKASNPQVMIQAYRLLVAQMIELGWNYPLHLGVTEAGEGEDGRVKSAIGIGSLLLDGLGDTIRVSLTEDPWSEIDPCKRLVNFAHLYQNKGVNEFEENNRSIEKYQKRQVTIPKNSSLHRDGSVFVSIVEQDMAKASFFADLGCKVQFGKPTREISTVDAVVLENMPKDQRAIDKLQELSKVGVDIVCLSESDHPLVNKKIVKVSETQDFDSILQLRPEIIIFSPKDNYVHASRQFFEWMSTRLLAIPVILNFSYTCDVQDIVIHASAEFGSLFCDGLGEGILISHPSELAMRKSLSFGILQGARMRTSKTEFISCPGCGRTLFNLQKVAERIRARTSHLPGVKIAIMGCIVNGPGEMADADFGYVGSKPGKIDLYVGKTKVQTDIEFDDADEKLIELIKAHGRWIEPESICNIYDQDALLLNPPSLGQELLT